MPAIPFPYYRLEPFPLLQFILSILLIVDILVRVFVWYSKSSVLDTHSRQSLAASIPSHPLRVELVAPPKSPTRQLSASSSTSVGQLEKRLNHAAFDHFADCLILSNKIWAQHALIHNLHRALLSSRNDALNSFWDRVCLQNEIWKQRRDINILEREKVVLKGGRVKSIVGMAKALAGKGRALRNLQRHVIGSKPNDSPLTRSFIDRPRIDTGSDLARVSWTIKQEISNTTEDDLRMQLAEARRENGTLNDQVSSYEKLIDGLWRDLQRPKIDSPVA